jgi:hypothetical protein
MSQDHSIQEASRPVRGTHAAQTILFWALAGLALAAFVPCILVPEWKHYELLHLREQWEQFRVDQLQAAVNREKRLLEAIRTDPAVVARLAQRDLGLARRNERAILVSVPSVPEPSGPRFAPTPPELPSIVARWRGFLPNYEYESLFTNPRTRVPILLMSTGLMALAFWLFGRESAA